MSGTLILKDVRLAFPQLWEPHPESGKFNALGIFEPGSPVHMQLEDAIEKLMDAKWHGKVRKESLRQFCLHDGADKSAKYDGFDGMMYISASSGTQPTIVDRDGRTPLTRQSGKPYSGCRVLMYISLWTQDNNYGKGVNAELRGIQFMRDDAAFGGGGRPMEMDEFVSLDDDDLEGASIFG